MLRCPFYPPLRMRRFTLLQMDQVGLLAFGFRNLFKIVLLQVSKVSYNGRTPFISRSSFHGSQMPPRTYHPRCSLVFIFTLSGGYSLIPVQWLAFRHGKLEVCFCDQSNRINYLVLIQREVVSGLLPLNPRQLTPCLIFLLKLQSPTPACPFSHHPNWGSREPCCQQLLHNKHCEVSSMAV